MSSEPQPYKEYDPEDLSLSTSMGSSIALFSLYPMIIEQLPLYMDYLSDFYYAPLPCISIVQQQYFVIGLLLGYFQASLLPTMIKLSKYGTKVDAA